MELDYKSIGARIKGKRKHKAFTQAKLAELAGLSNTHISNIESGNTQLSIHALIMIANALGTTTDSLLCDNLKNAKETFTNEIIFATSDCDEVEIRIICDTIHTLKKSIRKRKAFFFND